MSRRGFAGALVVGAALVLPTGVASAEPLPEGPGGCEQDPVICQSGVPVEEPTVAADDSNATVYTVVGVGAGLALLGGGAVAARRRRSTVEA